MPVRCVQEAKRLCAECEQHFGPGTRSVWKVTLSSVTPSSLVAHTHSGSSRRWCVSCHCCDTAPRMWWLEQCRLSLLRFQRPEALKSRGQQGYIPVEAVVANPRPSLFHFLGASCLLGLWPPPPSGVGCCCHIFPSSASPSRHHL